MSDTNNGGGSEKPKKGVVVRLPPIRLQTPKDETRPLSAANLDAVAAARETHEENRINAPIRARILGFLTQNREVYAEIKKARENPKRRLWFFKAPFPPNSKPGYELPSLRDFFEKIKAEEMAATRKAIDLWLQREFAHDVRMEPAVWVVEDTGGVFIRWQARPSRGGDDHDAPA